MHVPVLPWERGSASSVFNGHGRSVNECFVAQPLPVAPCKKTDSAHTTSVNNTANTVVSSNAWRVVACRLSNLPWRESEERSRAFALARWRTIIQTDTKCDVRAL